MNTYKPLINSSVIAGFYIGLATILIFLIQYSLDIMPVGLLKPILLWLIGFAITITILIITLKNFRNEQGGFITFLNAFLFSVIALVCAAFLSSFFTYVFIEFFEPDYIRNIMEAQLVWTENFMMRQGVADEQIDKTISKIIEQMEDATAFSQAFGSFHWRVVVNVVIALVFAAIMKKTPDIFAEGAAEQEKHA